jgi:hypothetical protein
MPGPLVIVELPTVDTTLPEAAALVRACSEGLGSGGRCELSSRAEEPAAAVAVVSLRDADALEALVEVGSRRLRSRPWRSQEITFQPQDQRLERFRTLGFAIATLFRETQVQQRTEPATRSAEITTAANTKSDTSLGISEPARLAPRHSLGWLSGGAVTGYDHRLPSAWRWGAQLAIGVAPLKLPLFFGVSASYALAEVDLDAQAMPALSLSWTTFGVGLGGYVRLPAELELRGGVQAVLVDIVAGATDSERGQHEARRRMLGGQVGIELVGLNSRRWGLALGAHLQQLTGATSIAMYDRPAATVAAFSWFLTASAELRLFQQ